MHALWRVKCHRREMTLTAQCDACHKPLVEQDSARLEVMVRTMDGPYTIYDLCSRTCFYALAKTLAEMDVCLGVMLKGIDEN